jgi:hypothetical protein
VKIVSERGSVCGQMQNPREQRNETEGSEEKERMRQLHHLNPQGVYLYLILCRINSHLRMVSMHSCWNFVSLTSQQIGIVHR